MELENYIPGLTVNLPVPLGSTVWQICRNPAFNAGVESAEMFLFDEVRTPRYILRQTKFSLSMVEEWGKRVFAAEAEGERTIQSLQ